MGGHRHDGSGAVGGQNIVGHPDGDFLSIHRIDRKRSQGDSGLGFGEFGAFQVGFCRAFPSVCLHRRSLGSGGYGVDQGMFGSQHHIGGPEEGVGASGIDRDLFPGIHDREIDLRAFTFSNPVPLHLLQGVGPFEEIEIL